MAGLSAEGLPEEELVSWSSFDGRTIPGFLLRPRGAPKTGERPTVVQVHGGPEGQARPLWNPLTVALVAAGVQGVPPNLPRFRRPRPPGPLPGAGAPRRASGGGLAIAPG